MTTKKQSRTAAAQKTSLARNHTEADPLAGWFDLAKSSRANRKQKRGWQRKQRGEIEALVAASLALTALALALIVVSVAGWLK